MTVKGQGRPTKGYRTKDGKRRPSSTTITGFMKSANLLGWAYNRGLDGEPLYESRDKAASVGSIVHKWIEQHLFGERLNEVQVGDKISQEMFEQANTGFSAYKKWADGQDIEILYTEVPLVSEIHAYGGTLDAIAKVNGDVVLLDWKTSSGTYPDYIAQVASYRELVAENLLDDDGPVDTAYLLRVGKDYGDFHLHYFPSMVLDLGWEWFLGMKKVYEMDKILKSVAS